MVGDKGSGERVDTAPYLLRTLVELKGLSVMGPYWKCLCAQEQEAQEQETQHR